MCFRTQESARFKPMKIFLYGGPYDGADFDVAYVDFSETIMVGRLPNKLDILVLGNRKFYQDLVSSVELSAEEILGLAKSLRTYFPAEIVGDYAKLVFRETKQKPESFFSGWKKSFKILKEKLHEHKR